MLIGGASVRPQYGWISVAILFPKKLPVSYQLARLELDEQFCGTG